MKECQDFLGGHPPYDQLDRSEIERLARSAVVEPVPRGTVLVHAGSEPLKHVWVIRSGALEILDRGRLVDVLTGGETFGHVSLMSGLPPALTARAAEDTVCYRLPDPRTVLEQPDRLRFAHRAPAGWRRPLVLGDVGEGQNRAQVPVRTYMRPVVTCRPGDSIRAVAQLIEDAGQSCAVVAFPDDVGIVTDADFRRWVGSGAHQGDAPVHTIASRPAHSVTDEVVVAQAYAEMLEHHVHHLIVRGHGRRPVGVLRLVDLASAEVRDPVVVRAAIDRASTLGELAEACHLLPATAVELHDTGVPALRVGALLATLLEAVLRRLLLLDERTASVPTACSWVVLGSLARREALPGSDVDTALVWADPEPGSRTDPAGLSVLVLGAAHRVLKDLQRIGLETCSEGANADNPRFARSLSEWQLSTERWLRDPNSTQDAFLLSTMLADSRPVTEHALGHKVTDGLLAASRSPQFLKLLLDYSLSSRPPTGFVRDFVVEHSGRHRGSLNLKRGGLRPVTSIGRWVALVTGDARGTTPERLRRAVDARLLTLDESDTLIAAFEQIYELLLEIEVAAIRAGKPAHPYLAPESLDSLTRRHLRESFRAIAHVQGRLESIWTNRASG